MVARDPALNDNLAVVPKVTDTLAHEQRQHTLNCW